MDPRLPQLLERGLRHFALGEIDHAVACWHEVLAAEPQNRRAREYLELVASSTSSESDGTDGLELVPTDELPWFADPVVPTPEQTQALDDWLGHDAQGDLPPVAEGALAWQEWHSEVAFQGTGELPWNEEDAADVPVAEASASAGRDVADVPAGDAPAVAGFATADVPVPDVPAGDAPAVAGFEPADAPAADAPAVAGFEAMTSDGVEGSPWTPGPGSTGWDFAAQEGGVVQLDDALDADVLDMVEEAAMAPVAVPARVAGPFTPGSTARGEANTLMQGARELFDLGDFSGSLGLVQKALELQPAHREALAYLERNQDTLVQMYESKIGPLETRPRVVLRPDEIVWLNLDHRAGFVLAQIDGTISVDDIYALSGLSRLDTAKILAELVEQGVIAG